VIAVYILSILFSSFTSLNYPQLSIEDNILESFINTNDASLQQESNDTFPYFEASTQKNEHHHLLLTEPDSEEKIHFKNFNQKNYSLSLSDIDYPMVHTITFPFHFNNKSWQVHQIPNFLWNQVFRL